MLCSCADYGATAWVRQYGDNQLGYFILPVRYFHWQGWYSLPPARPGEGGEPGTYEIPLAFSKPPRLPRYIDMYAAVWVAFFSRWQQ